MKKCINAWCYPASLSLDEKFMISKEHGFEAIEINMEEEANGQTILALDSSAEDINKIAELSKKYELPISSISTGLFWKYPYSHESYDMREKSKTITMKMIDAAKLLGCDAILVVPALVTSNVSYEVAYIRAIEALKDLALYAEQNKVYIGIENVWNKFLLSPLEARSFVDRVASPYVKFYFDVGNVLVNGYPEQWIKILESRIVRIHIKDFKNEIGNVNGFVNLMQGDVNWNAVFVALKEIGYNGFITAELSPDTENPARLIKETSTAMDSLFSIK